MNSALAFLFWIFASAEVHSSSLIDSNFKLQRLQKGSLAQPRQELTVLYRDFLAQSMSSRCRWFPSDSEYMQLASHACGPARGTILAFSRFMTEHDAYRITDQSVIDNGTLRFVDFERPCDLH